MMSAIDLISGQQISNIRILLILDLVVSSGFQEEPVGLERLSPYTDVAVIGLNVGTLWTLVSLPMFINDLDNDKEKRLDTKAVSSGPVNKAQNLRCQPSFLWISLIMSI